MNGRPIQLDRYQGFLKPWISDIAEFHAADIAPQEIANRLRQSVRDHYLPTRGMDYPYLNATNIIYALLRIGAINGRPVNLDSPYYKSQAKRRDRQLQKIQRWQSAANIPATQFIAALIASDTLAINKGRPLDMGGPRDAWIEQSPWDDR